MNRTGFLGDLIAWEDGVYGTFKSVFLEVRERAVRMVEEHREAYASEWAVLQSVAPKLGCTAETLRKWVRQAQRDAGHRLVAEMGGKNPALVLASADLEKAADGVLRSAFGAQGQKCSACSRVYMAHEVRERFVEVLKLTGAWGSAPLRPAKRSLNHEPGFHLSCDEHLCVSNSQCSR